MMDPTGIILSYGPNGSWSALYFRELLGLFGLEKLLAGDFEPVYFAGTPQEWRGNRHPMDIAREAKNMWESSDKIWQEGQLRWAEALK